MSSAAPMQQAKTEALAKTTDRSIQLAPQSDLMGATEHADLRNQASSQRKLQSAANHSQQSHQFKAMQQVAQANARATQLKSISAMMKTPSVQRVEDEEALQAKSIGAPVQREASADASQTPKPNNTGLPDHLKSGIESLSGMSMDHVKVHYNSPQPAQLNAHAYAQGSDIHVAPGQEQHLPHEAWHVVQQAQGRVKPTMQMKTGVPVNDDAGLEAEADVMGTKAFNQPTKLTQRQVQQVMLQSLPARWNESSNVTNSDTKQTLQLKTYQHRTHNNQSMVLQRVTYCGQEYSGELRNLKAFHTKANDDLDKLDEGRDQARDKTMLNVIGNGEEIIESPEELLTLIHPEGKEYQTVLNNEMKVLTPALMEIRELAEGAHRLAPQMKTDTSTESHEYVITNMDKVQDKNKDVMKLVQWKKVEAITPLATISMEKAYASMNAMLEYKDPNFVPSKQQAKKQEKADEVITKGIKTVVDNTETIAKTATEVEPALRNSADEQYLRGKGGAGPKGGEKHLSIGKKTATKPLLENNPEEAKGILWASVWSMGVNKAFIEGGTDESHEFRLISPFPDELGNSLRTGNTEEFIRIARDGTIRNKGLDPWRAYYHLGNDQLTTLGEEIVHLLQHGYVMS